MNGWYSAPAGLLIDMLVGDPGFITHPVIIMGRLISWLDSKLRRPGDSPGRQLVLGLALWCVVVGTSFGVTCVLLKAAAMLSPSIALLLNLWLVSTTIAAKGLADAGQKVARRLRAGDIEGARRAVGEIVGRDTDRMPPEEIIRAAVESIAENTVDGVISPLFYAAVGGAPLAMAYRAINTMDSMLGYKDKDFLYFGRAAARLDDAANFVPARLAGLLMSFAALLLGFDWRAAFRVWRRDAARHPSPNAGIPESVVAGALGLRLGGLNYYDGYPRLRATMGDISRQFDVEDISRSSRIMLVASVACAVVLAAGRLLIS